MSSFFHGSKESPPSSVISAVEETENLRVIRLKGHLDMSVVPAGEKFRKQVQGQPGFQYKNILFDFKDVVSMDSAAVALIISDLADLKHSHHTLGVINLTEILRDELRILKVDKLIVEYPTESDATKDLSHP